MAALKHEFEMIQSQEQLDEAGRKSRLIAQSLRNVFAYKDVLEAAFSYQAGSKGDMQKAVDCEHGNQEDEVDTDDLAMRRKKGEKIKIFDKDGKENAKAAEVAPKAMAVVFREANDFTKAAGVAEGIKKGDFKMIMSGVLSMLSDVAKVAGTLAADGAKAANQTLDKAMGDASKGFGDIAGGVLALASSAMLAKDGADLAAKLESGVPDVLGKIADALAGQTSDLKNIGTAVTAAGSAAAGVGELIRAKAKGDDITPAMIGTALGNCIDVAMKAADADLSNSKASNAAEIQKALDAVAKQLKAAADAFGKSPEAAGPRRPGSPSSRPGSKRAFRRTRRSPSSGRRRRSGRRSCPNLHSCSRICSALSPPSRWLPTRS